MNNTPTQKSRRDETSRRQQGRPMWLATTPDHRQYINQASANFINRYSLILVLKSIKSYHIFFFISIILLTSCSPKIQYDKVRKVPKHGLITPPGTVWLKDSLFMDKYEVSNEDYREYLWWNRFEDSTRKEIFPDTNVWIPDAQKMKYYLRHPLYSNYPVVGISYIQAVSYCKWKGDRINENYYAKTNKQFRKIINTNYDSFLSVPKYIKYSLPNIKEWEYAAQGGLDSNKYPYGYEKLYDKNGPVSMTLEGNLLMNANGPYPTITSVNFGKPNKYGIYNMLGNVSEIVNDTNVKGLNYKTLLTGFQIDRNDNFTLTKYRQLFTGRVYYPNTTSRFTYKAPTDYIGFRCICEVLKNP